MSEDVKKSTTNDFEKKVNSTMIKFCITALTLGVFFFVSNAAYAADVPANTTTTEHIGTWTSLNIVGEVVPGYEIQIAEEYRYNGADSSEAHTDISFGKKFNSWTAIAGYKNVFGEEHRPYLGVDIGLPNLAGFNTGLTTKFELRNLEELRQRIGAYAQTEIAGFAPYISNEVFFNISESSTNLVDKNRATLGVAKSITDTYAIEAYYNLDSQFTGDTTNNISIVGLGLNIAL
jgi:hypothetical protein